MWLKDWQDGSQNFSFAVNDEQASLCSLHAIPPFTFGPTQVRYLWLYTVGLPPGKPLQQRGPFVPPTRACMSQGRWLASHCISPDSEMHEQQQDIAGVKSRL